MASLNKICWNNTFSFTSNFELYKTLINSILLYECETWTKLADSNERIKASKTKCMRKLLSISLEHKTTDWVWSTNNFLVGPQKLLQATLKKRKQAWFRHATYHDSLSKTILQGTLEGGQCCGPQRKCWMDNTKEWTTLPMLEPLTVDSWKKHWKRISAKSSVISPKSKPMGQGTEVKSLLPWVLQNVCTLLEHTRPWHFLSSKPLDTMSTTLRALLYKNRLGWQELRTGERVSCQWNWDSNP